MTLNKNIKGWVLAIGLLLCGLLSSCDLTQKPKDYIPFDKSFETIQDAEKWDNGLYSTFRGKFGGGYILPQEAQADMLNAHAAVGTSYVSFHSWDLKSNDPVIDQVYHSYYAALADANIMLEELPKVPTTTEEEKTKIRHFTGHAHLVRAFYHFNLTIRWGQRYNASTASTDLAVPLVTKYEPTVKLARSTNEVVWAHILSDLQKAEELLHDVPTREGNDAISADVARALRARVLLYMDDMEGALKASEALIESGTYPLIAVPKTPVKDIPLDEDEFVLMWHRDSGKEQIFQPFVDKPNELPTTTPLYGADLSTYTHHKESPKGQKDLQFNKPIYIPTGWIEKFYSDDDRRPRAYFEWAYTTVNEIDKVYGPILVISKYKGNPKYRDLESDKWGGYVPNGIQAPKPFRIAEQYLIAAEAAFKTKDEVKAKQYLNQLRVSRGLKEVDATGDDLWKEIMDERTRELAYEGFRLWDIRRWGLEMHRHDPQFAQKGGLPFNPYLSGQFDLEIKRDNSDPKFVWGFPLVETKANLKIVQNEGW